MALISMKEMLRRARKGGYAVCYCESWNLESFQAVLQAAEETRSPIIAGFNGGFLAHPGRAKAEDLTSYAGFKLALQRTDVPAAFLLNETDSLAQIDRAIELGFNAVMLENENLGWDEYRSLVKQLVNRAHAKKVSVEAQVGRLANAAEKGEGEQTDPDAARMFVEETGIDALSVAVGNVHILTQGKVEVDLDSLRRIHAVVKIPLVLHGGTGIPLRQAASLIRCGVAKVNFGTTLKQAYLEAIRTKLEGYRKPLSPHPFLGMGGREDILVAGRDVVKARVKELLQTFGSAGKAP